MKKLIEVEEAKALMIEAAANWSVMKWLREKKRVRKTADKANDTLWALQKEVKTFWSDDLRAAYDELGKEGNSKPGRQSADLIALARSVKELDDAAWRAHMDAEETFDKAERILSTSMARDGARKAINSWELYEKAITKAESGVRSTAA